MKENSTESRYHGTYNHPQHPFLDHTTNSTSVCNIRLSNIPKWPSPESPISCMPPIPKDTERDHAHAESLDVKEVWVLSESMEST
ncbi:hypothetical protein IV203_030767 [Nitzschia inconspicua]|uniref:Uncharacterized protein n=1 Tax=Nitzschia inconspicua TaxID=303405 RepID=A0A9K3Q4H8_9STRA|nr:hypothetical protein IV203_030767 [Nitzschia inconspicua]